MNSRPSFRSRPLLFGALLVVLGGILLWGGTQLLMLGGSPYYVLAGLATLASGLLVFAARREGAAVYWAMLVVTTAWALWEVGTDGWSLAARLVAPIALGLWFVMPWTWKRLAGRPAATPLKAFAVAALGLAVAAVVGWGLHGALAAPVVDPIFQAGTQASAPGPVGAAMGANTGGDWRNYGNDPGGTRFSPLDQITPANVGKLQVAWTYRFGPAPKGAPEKLQVTPIKIDDSVYVCTAYNDVVSLDAESGRQNWRFRSGTDATASPYGACRGVAYSRVPNATGACAERIFTNTVDARLIALDARTGRPCAGFGTNGIVSLLKGMSPAPKGYYYTSSAPTIAKGHIVLGGWVFDGMFWGEPSGVIRAFDAVTGNLSWAFDLGRPDRKGEPPAGEYYTPSTPNSWAPMSADEELGLVYVPLGGAALDFSGARRRPFDEAYSGAIVALDAATGTERWKFQTVHHDLWDYDIASQPTLVDLPVGGVIRKALVQATKRGEMFVLDRQTGQPIYPVTEHPAPQTNLAPGEWAAKTQPFSDAMPSFRGALVTEKSMWGLTPLDQLWCRIQFRQSQYDGPLTPPGLRASIAYPGFLGGSDWGGVSIDADRKLLIVNSNHVANRNILIPRAEADKLGVHPVDLSKEQGVSHGLSAQKGTPYAVQPSPFLSLLFAPCQAPPYGRLTAVDLVSRKVVWSHPIGTARDSGPMGLASQLPFTMGTPNMGGAVTTRGGLVFIGATQDRYIRAFSSATGEMLWQARLPAGGQATPMTYTSAKSGRQFVVIAAGGHLMLNTKIGDYIIAYALPAAH
ncbi:MAG TPA: membrane-bound PQQ-dependent dehydrogenase, glucose/quinate/shikimate family [Novosphingobium sp.]|nr:membrane-bound PQQ-dependent dehydrogenase, glucose/quinate/shikimate family [Novosphingobium sp.]